MTPANADERNQPAAAKRNFANRWRILALLGLAQLMVVLDVTIVNIALPSAQQALNFSAANRQWVITAYALSFGSLLLVGGRVSDMFGRKWTFVGGLLGFAAVSAVGGAAPSFGVLVAARAVQGGFAALLAPAALSLLNTTFMVDRERRIAFAIYGGIAGAGGAVGLLLGGVLTQYLSWRWCLYVNLVIAVPTALTAVGLVSNVRAYSSVRIDLLGTLLACSGLFCLVFGLDRAQADGWTATITLSFLIASAVLLTAFTLWERRRDEPLLPLPVVVDRNRGGSYLAILINGLVLFGVFLFLTYYLQDTLRMSPTIAGVSFLPMVAVLMSTAVLAQTKLLPRFGPRLLIGTGMAVATVALVIFAQVNVGSHYASVVLPGLLVAGLGVGLVFAPAMNTATRGVTEQHAGAASAMVNTCQQIGGSIGTTLLSTIATTATTSFVHGKLASAMTNPQAASLLHLVHGRPAPSAQLLVQASVHGYTTAFWVAAAISAGGAIVCGLLLRAGAPAPLDSVALQLETSEASD